MFFNNMPQSAYGFGGNLFSPQQMQGGYATQPIVSQIVRVSGIESAKAYRMQPNCNALILDENNPLLYYVTSDGAGYNTVNVFDIVPHVGNPQSTPEQFVTRAEFNELKEMFINAKPDSSTNGQQSGAKRISSSQSNQ